MTTPTFRQDLQQFFKRHPTAFAVFIFLQSFALFALGECIHLRHPNWSFRTQVGDLAARALFFAVFLPVLFQYLQKRRDPSSPSAKPLDGVLYF